MSRIGKHPIPVPAEVSVSIEAGNVVTVKGPKGTLTQTFHPDMIIKQESSSTGPMTSICTRASMASPVHSSTT